MQQHKIAISKVVLCLIISFNTFKSHDLNEAITRIKHSKVTIVQTL